MKKLSLTLGISTLILSGCFFGSDENNKEKIVKNAVSDFDTEKLSLADVRLPQAKSPFVWGSYIWDDPADSLFPGKVDTTYRDDCHGEEYFPMPHYTPVYMSHEKYRSLIGLMDTVEILNPGKIMLNGDFKYVTDVNRGIHIIDRSDVANPKKVAFYHVPGAIDIAMKNKNIIVNSYSNLVSLNVSNPAKPEVESIIVNTFPQVYKYGQPMVDSLGGLAAAWQVDTTYDCYLIMYDVAMDGGPILEKGQTNSPGSKDDSFGKTGSMSRFELTSDYLYAVDREKVNVFDVSNESEPKKAGKLELGWDIETVFRVDTALFVGSRTGMYIVNVKKPWSPVLASEYAHMTSCDPVVVEDEIAYVTLSSGNGCWNGDNQLEIIDVADIYKPKEIAVYPMKNPKGLAVEDKKLYLCEGDHGMKIFDVENSKAIQQLAFVEDLTCEDLIKDGNQLSVMGKDGLYEVDVSNPNEPSILSKSAIDYDGDEYVNRPDFFWGID